MKHISENYSWSDESDYGPDTQVNDTIPKVDAPEDLRFAKTNNVTCVFADVHKNSTT